ncbi:MAG: hypothetical protein KGL79_08470 [Acidobacteriota bacterium]|nr:hypothetical protein [Acidobacteriota bacterium]
MFHRISSWWRALVVVVLSLATLTWPTSVPAAGFANFHVVHQSAVTTLPRQGVGTLRVTLRLVHTTSTANELSLTVYPALIDRATLESVAHGDGVSTAPLDTSTVPLGCVTKSVTTFVITIYTRHRVSPSGPCASTRPLLHLSCASSGCDGVYPLRLRVRLNGAWRTEWTLFAVERSPVVRPLHVALVATAEPRIVNNPARAVAVLQTLARAKNAPLALALDYRLLNDLAATPASNPLRQALTNTLASPEHLVLNAPPASIDFAGLLANGFTTQVDEQLNLTDSLLQSLTGRYGAGPLYVTGGVTTAAARALTRAGVTNVVLPESALASPPSQTLNWGAPFRLPGVAKLTALASDGPLSALCANAAIEPGRRAALALATLAFLHFEAPNAPDARTVVVTLPVDAVAAVFVRDFLQGFAGDPFAQLSSLPPLFSSSLIATNGSPAVRTPAPVAPAPRWSSRNVSALSLLIGEVNSYVPAISSDLVRNDLRVAVAQSEIVGPSSERAAALSSANALFTQQLQNFSVDPSTITLAGPGTNLPITVISHAGYPVTVVVHLITDRLTFAKGNAVATSLESPTNTIRVATNGARGSSLTLQVVVTTPNDQVVLARAAIQVRIAGTSVVGYVLSAASLLVLGLWWYRTNRRRSKGRHAR